MKATLLSAPLKKTEDVNWVKPLNNYLLSVYGSSSEFQEDITNFNKTRQDACGSTADASGIDAYLNYFSQLELLDLRIPMSTVNKRKAINFKWHDAFSLDSEQMQSSLAFEKASILFNIGALFMKASSAKYIDSQKTANDGENTFKDAVQLMEQGAGVFKYLSESFLHGPSDDLKPPTVKFLSSLCSAQSQEIFTLKVIDGDLEQKKNSLISRLCAACSESYEECHKQTSHLIDADGSTKLTNSSDFSIKEIGLDDEALTIGEDDDGDEYNPSSKEPESLEVHAKIDPSWVAILHIKFLYYKSLSYYFQALHLESTKKYGEALAYLKKSSETIEKISSASIQLVSKNRTENIYELLDNFKYQKDAVALKLKDLGKDNDLIYHDIVPSLNSLPEPKPMNSSKVIPMNKIMSFSQINERNYNNFLTNVVPVSIHELLSYYSEEKSQFLRNEIDAVDVSNEELSSVLEFLNFPKALVSLKELMRAEKPLSTSDQESLMDPTTLSRVNEISRNYSSDQNKRREIARMRDSILESINNSERILSNAPSSISQGLYRDDLIKLKKSLYEASNSDSRLYALVDLDYSTLFPVLGKGVNSEEFKALYADSGSKITSQSSEPEVSLLDLDDGDMGSTSSTVDGKISHLENLCYELNLIKANKNSLIEELKKAIHNDDIADILLINSRVKSTNEIKTIIFPEELKKFEAYSNKLDQLIGKQKDLIGEIKVMWQELSSNPRVRSIQESSTYKNELIEQQKSKINQFYETAWQKYSSGLRQGLEFYKNLFEFASRLHQALIRDVQTREMNQAMSTLSLKGDSTRRSSDARVLQYAHPFSNAPAVASHPLQSGGQAVQRAPTTANATPGSLWRNEESELYTQYTQSNGPKLPPKRPTQTSNTGISEFPSVSAPDQTGESARQTFPTAPGPRRQDSGSGLIYDNPSTYQPDMYNFFSQNRH